MDIILRKFWAQLRKLPWFDIAIFLVSVGIGLLVFKKTQTGYLKSFDPNSVLTNLLTINGVFSAVLMTFLFSRLSWVKERKLEIWNEAMEISQKITEFRRILYILTQYYQVWDNDKGTKSLLGFGKYSSVEYWELRAAYSGANSAKREKLIEELRANPDFDEGRSALYLAMLSLVHLNGREQFSFENELYHEFGYKAVYALEMVEKWIDYDYFGIIGYWMNRNVSWIRYDSLGKDKNKIKEAAIRINPKFTSYEVGNKMLEEIAGSFTSHYLAELQRSLMSLKKGNHSLNLLITILICCSLFFGIFLPLVLLLIVSENILFREYINVVASINASLICFLIIKFPFIINKELRFI